MRLLLVSFVFIFASGILPAQTASGKFAASPPMGWNSWDSFGLSVTEAEYKANAEWMKDHLKKSGWQYAVVDEGWYLANPASKGKPSWQFTLSPDGRYMPASNRFPSAANDAGFKPLATYVHSLGLKFGIHIIRGIPREAVARNLPIAGSQFHAADAAEQSDTCSWNPDNYGIKDTPAGQAYYDSIAKLYAGWGVDFLKIDCISSRPYRAGEIRMISTALRKTGRPIVLSLSPGPTSLEKAAEVAKYAQMWRVSDDFWDVWQPHGKAFPQTLYGQFAVGIGWAPHIGAGHWPDADMLPIGYLGPRPGYGEARTTNFTHNEGRTLLSLWSIMRSPLIIGGNLTRNDDWTTSLLTNDEVIAVNQQSTANRPIIITDKVVVWRAQAVGRKGTYLAIFNRGDHPEDFERHWNEFGLDAANYHLRDLWEHRDLGSMPLFKFRLEPHSAMLCLVTN